MDNLVPNHEQYAALVKAADAARALLASLDLDRTDEYFMLVGALEVCARPMDRPECCLVRYAAKIHAMAAALENVVYDLAEEHATDKAADHYGDGPEGCLYCKHIDEAEAQLLAAREGLCYPHAADGKRAILVTVHIDHGIYRYHTVEPTELADLVDVEIIDHDEDCR